ncbi:MULTISPECIES: hypothetical protein [Prauserella salsuginis group]|uniref:DUF4350 domain-containing protein n=1 Tax=Prauserella salsuginis TaxID=387889 RepID=A0ABW6G7T0_9PSEU|nr:MULTISPECIES: hypothetical protein [Prauserella salsuginis group]MCR3719611.1 hypothetical protein [Prauserella flava]MCR3735375.1 hypothetical protein [Prauserella salsuginis]
MADRILGIARWALAGVAILVAVVFLFQQRQGDIDVSYGGSPSVDYKEGDAGELSDHTVPTTEEMARQVQAEPVVRLPGATATWDRQWLREHVGTTGVRLLLAPPGLDKQERERVSAVAEDPAMADAPFELVTAVGTNVRGGPYTAEPDDLDGFQRQFAANDVTGLLAAVITGMRDGDDPPSPPGPTWREPSPAELDAVTADLERYRLHVADGATLSRVPDNVGNAFPDTEPMIVALPQQARDRPIPDYAPALAERFPDTPVVVLYGNYVDYAGAHRDQFYEVATAGVYGMLGARLSRFDYPQDNVLYAWLNKVTDIRYAGLFDRPLPYQPFDPLKVTLPALPFVFAGCVLGVIILSVTALRRRPSHGRPPTVRLAALSALSVEVSGLTTEASNPSLTRAISHLDAAREQEGSAAGRRAAHELLDKAEHELAETAQLIGRSDYEPRHYTAGWGV